MGDFDLTNVITSLNLSKFSNSSYAIKSEPAYVSISDEIVEAVLQRLSPQFTALKCRECGGSIEQKYGNPIVKCPYCGTVYIIGAKQINSAT